MVKFSELKLDTRSSLTDEDNQTWLNALRLGSFIFFSWSYVFAKSTESEEAHKHEPRLPPHGHQIKPNICCKFVLTPTSQASGAA